MREIVEFETEMFAPVLPEDSQVNPQVYGAELAYWLCADLQKRGVTTSYPEYEDWGWYIEYFTESGSEFAIHCYNIEGSKNHWLLSLRRHARKLFGRDKPAYSEANELIEAVRESIQSTAETSAIKWLYDNSNAT